MEEKIRIHVNNLFEEAPKTKRVYDLKEELISNLTEKQEDLMKEGKTEKEAYENVVSGIGDISELISSIEQDNPMNGAYSEKRRKKNALIVSASVGLYIFSLMVISILDEVGIPDYIIGTVFFVLAGVPTCLLIYHFMSQPKYMKQDDTIVEDFKKWKADKNASKEILSAITSIMWLLIVAVYFWIGFAFSAWAYSWIIFILGAAFNNIIRLYFKLKEVEGKDERR